MRARPLLHKLLDRFGPSGRAVAQGGIVADAMPEDMNGYAGIIGKVQHATMTSPARLSALIESTRYVVRAGVSGAIVECGVWRGGSMMAAAHTLLELGERRELYLFDTFAGMSRPSEVDVDPTGLSALPEYLRTSNETHSDWCYASLDEVRENLEQTGYPMELCHLIKGDVKETLPHDGMGEIAILRLDTDWYDTTLHELETLYAKLSRRGVLIIDDYGHWAGCRRAVHEFFGDALPLLVPVDDTGRVAVKID